MVGTNSSLCHQPFRENSVEGMVRGWGELEKEAKEFHKLFQEINAVARR